MRSPTDPRVLAAGLILLLAACTPTPSPVTSAASIEPSIVAPTSTPAPSESAFALALPEPGQPFDAATLLEEMRTSTRPDGVPDILETDVLAGRLATAIWTFDGEGWSTTTAGGSCGSTSCTLEIAGSRSDGSGEDLWVFEIDPATGDVSVVSAELRAIPDDLVADLDALARAEAEGDLLDGLELTTAKWQPPPSEGTFELSYRAGAEEGSCAVELTVDARAGTITDEETEDC